MSSRFQHLRRFFRISTRIYTGSAYGLSRTSIDRLETLSSFSLSNVRGKVELTGFQEKRYSSASKIKCEMLPPVDILSYIRSSLNKPEGPFHCWLNKSPNCNDLFKKDRIFLILFAEYGEDSSTSDHDIMNMFEKVKSLQQRYPSLQVLALQYGRSICTNDVSTHLLQRVVKEFITFPVLLSNKNIFEMANGNGYIISKGFKNPLVYHEKDLDIMVLDKAIHDLNAQISHRDVIDFKRAWVKPIEVVKEPDVCSASRNLLFSFPGCISADESGNRLFLSDINHHRIIVFDRNGKILDAIGSSPGFEDGEFESAKLMRPAASYYHADEDCLYFVDSENHAIRRADMDNRVVETVFPALDNNKNKSFWKSILDKIWTKKNEELKVEEFNSESLMFPWHLLRSSKNDLFVLNRSLRTLWIIDLESGTINEVVKDPSKILEICGQMIMEKSGPVKQIPADWLKQQMDCNCSLEGIPFAGLMSSAVNFSDHVVFCDTVGQMVVKIDPESGSAASFQFSNFGILGLPYWLSSSPLERYYADHNMLPGIDLDHSQSYSLLPGRVDITLIIDIPPHTDLVEQPQEGCIWHQARGTAAELSGVDNKASSSEKVGIAQQWYDEIDNLCFTTPEEESIPEEENRLEDMEVQEGRFPISCTIQTSPGTSEAIIYAAIYLRLKKNNTNLDTQEKKAEKIADILDPTKKFRRDRLIKLLLSKKNLEELVFMKPLHVRLKFDSPHYPKAENTKDIIITDSSLKVHITL